MTKPSTDTAQASPTKQFFVSMLTRDISLADAILDLLDNCLDGAMRLANGIGVDYAQHFVDIGISEDHFSIADNCGGIPRDVAKNYAFKMGREPDDDRDSDAETIGMYGVGMKRAIFKMGRYALVRTRHGDDTFEVPITSAWLDDKDWKPLPINEPNEAEERLNVPGTTIYVSDLREGVSRHFANGAFENEVRTAIAEHFTMFIQWGLRVSSVISASRCSSRSPRSRGAERWVLDRRCRTGYPHLHRSSRFRWDAGWTRRSWQARKPRATAPAGVEPIEDLLVRSALLRARSGERPFAPCGGLPCVQPGRRDLLRTRQSLPRQIVAGADPRSRRCRFLRGLVTWKDCWKLSQPWFVSFRPKRFERWRVGFGKSRT